MLLWGKDRQLKRMVNVIHQRQ